MPQPLPYRELLLRRDLLANIPALAEGEPFYATDTKQLFVGSSTGNIIIAGGYIAANNANWAGSPPATLVAAVQRLEACVALLNGAPIP